MVSESDLGVNFFLDQSSLGRSRAECCAEMLQELNPEVHGDWFPKHEARPAAAGSGPKRLCVDVSQQQPVDLQAILNGLQPFTVIIYTFPINPAHLALVHDFAEAHKTPVISIHSVGFYSYFHIHLPGAFPIVDTHPDETATTDLRLLTPWDQLSFLARDLTEDIESLDDHEHGHLPFVVILLHYLDVWKRDHNDKYPSTYADKVAFREKLSQVMRKDNPEGGEENFEEAIAAVLKTVAAPTLPPSLKEVFDYEHINPVRYAIACAWAISLTHFSGRDEIRILDHCGCHKAVLSNTQSLASPR
jgi:amyloid beta precursor protein binding protein 1